MNQFGQGPQYYGQPQMMPQYQMQMPRLNGRVVNDINEVLPNEIPFGQIAVFPVSDFSKIYTKQWDGNGTSIITNVYELPQKQDNTIADILRRLELLEKRGVVNE